jgi:hypothetical protein
LAAGVVGASVAFFVAFASLWLNRPGLYMDEANFVDAALGGHFPHQLYVYESLHGVPVLIIPYIGTLKAAIFAPIFGIWGVSVSTIRIPAIAISAASLVVAYFMGREVIGRWSAVLVVLMGTCPTFIFMSKVDWGPIVVAIFLTLWFLLAFFRYLNTGGIGWLWAVFGFALLGLFDKQNFLWVIIAVCAGAVAVYRTRLWQLARGRPEATILAVAAGAFGFLMSLPLVLPNLSAQGGSSSLQDPLSRLGFVWGLFERTVGYSEVIRFFTGHTVVQPVWMDLQWVLSLAALAVLALRRRKGPLPDSALVPARAAVFFLVVFGVMLLEIAATKKGIGPQHVIELMPYPALILLCSLVAVLRSGTTFRVGVSVIASAGLAIMLAAQAVSMTQYVSLMQNPSRLKSLFSTAVYHDAAFLNANIGGADEVVSAGWGPGTPLFSLACSDDRPKYRDDLWRHLVGLTPTTAPAVVRRLFGDHRILLVSVNNAALSVPRDLRSKTRLLRAAYISAYPGRRPQVLLTTSAYDITYFGPQPFEPGHDGC